MPGVQVLGVLGGLLLVLRLQLEAAHGRDRVQDPGELGVLGDVGLHEQRAARRVDPAREQRDGEVEDALLQAARRRSPTVIAW